MKTPHPVGNLTAAKSAGLRYVNDSAPGITRRRAGSQFTYHAAGSTPLRDPATLARIKRLAIPPAWTDVWICPHDDGHIQATGRDARGRKQYRYHAHWREARDETKYQRMIAFGKALPRIRRRIARDIAARGLGRDKVLATMVRLLETTLVRVGNEEYARDNGSFGLSTMRDKHVRVRASAMHFAFKGKSGKQHHITLRDPRLARIVRQVQDLPGQELFQYVDEAGQTQDIKSDDVNAYLHRLAGEEFSAKDFRTWAGTVLAAIALQQFEPFTTKAAAKKNLVAAIERVASRLGNTPAVCRKCYIHPIVLQSYLDGATVQVIRERAEDALSRGLHELTGAEGAVLAFLEAQLRRRQPPSLHAALRKSLQQTRRRARDAKTDSRPPRHHRRVRDREISGGARAAAR